MPHRLDFADLGEKAVAADVEAVSFVAFGARDTTNKIAGLKDHHLVFGRHFEKLISGGQTCRPTTNDNNTIRHTLSLF